MLRVKWWVLGIVLGLLAGPALAGQEQYQVDVALVLAVDVSASVDEGEAGIQRAGYIAALRDPRVADAIRGGLIGRIALTYVEWAGPNDQRQVIPWREVHDAASAAAFSDELKNAPYHQGSTTSISGGLDFSVKLLQASGISAMRRVIDISGDGTSDFGRPIAEARADALRAGVIINGLPVMDPNASQREKIPPDLDKYYAEKVAGGRGSFTLVVRKLDDFNKTILQKLILEIALNNGLLDKTPS